MTLNLLPFKKTLNKAYQKVKPNRSDMERFKTGLIKLLDRIDHEESEENHKFHLRDFLNEVWYKDAHLIAPKGKTDLVIHEERNAQSPAVVLFEVKRQKNLGDMIRPESPNAKAMHELILYYLRERVELGNTDIKHLVITNIYDWYIFDGATFDRLFYQNKKLLKEYERWRNDQKVQHTTDFFYKDIAKPFLETMDGELTAAHFSIKDYEKQLRNNDPNDDAKLIPLVKILSPQHLLRLPFANDSNSLNEGFYKELLYLIGLEEEKEGGKKLIRRCAPERRHPGSLLENTTNIILYEDRMRHVRSNDVFEVALELCITWVNRLLFLKLLESQLVKYHGGDASYRFLTSKLIKDFDGLNKLFFQVLAEKPEMRPETVKTTFAKVPYLNSSLFEITDMEAAAIRINSLEDELMLPLYPRSVLMNDKYRRTVVPIHTLEYIFAFLDAYDFASEGSEEIQEENKALINASVLGLIFEKINGYKDGSFFTPGFITMYMCRETVRRAVVQKFNQHYEIDCADFDDLQNYTARLYKKEDVLMMNRLVNSLRICDPAVGSGHFLVSALNELIAVKSELGILADTEGNVLRGYAATVENDELVVTCNDGQDLFEYRLANGMAGREAQRVQETIFHEKQTIIENCLFGVDINPNSVKICRLRLWIELLKNTFYRGGTDPGGLETLPNIDINIKTGNSLISRFALDADLSKALKSVKYDIGTYRRYVQEYHHATDKETKRGLLLLIEQIKGDFRMEIHRNDKLNKLKSKLAGELYNLTQQGSLFGMSEAEAKKQQTATDKLIVELEKVEAQLKEAQENKIYENAFEWRFEFPEVLDAEGKFVGFDVVVGNPPYFSLSKIKEQAYVFKTNYQTYSKGADIYCLFYERGNQILKEKGLLTFITSNSWLRAIYGELLKKYFKENIQPVCLLNIEDAQVFDEATVESNILTFQEGNSSESFLVCNLESDYELGNSLSDYFRANSFEYTIPENGEWVIGSEETAQLKAKIEKDSRLLKDFDIAINFGIKTGFNEAFFLDEAKRNALVAENENSAEIIKPIIRGRDLKKYSHEFSHIYTVCTFPSHKLDIENYPSIKNHLLTFGKSRLEQSGNAGSRKKSNNKWFETQDSIGYWKDFEKPKIVWGEISDKPKFSYDEDGYYAEATTFIMTGEKLKYLLAILNSKVSAWYFNQISTTTGMGTNRWKKYKIEFLPIKVPSAELEAEITANVDQILSAKQADPQADTTALEQAVDKLVYGLYGLTEEEVGIVECV